MLTRGIMLIIMIIFATRISYIWTEGTSTHIHLLKNGTKPNNELSSNKALLSEKVIDQLIKNFTNYATRTEAEAVSYTNYLRNNGKAEESNNIAETNIDPQNPMMVETLEDSPAYASSVVLASDILSLTSAVSNIKDKTCRQQGYRFLDGLLMNRRWALRMFDASAKSPQGLLFGSSYHLGNFDECVEIEEEPGNNERQIEGKYCLATINWAGASKRRSGRSGELRWAVCVPASCNADDVRQFVLYVLAHTVGNSSRVTVDEHDCYVRRQMSVSMFDVTYLAIILFFLLVLIMSTGYEVFLNKSSPKLASKNSILNDAILSFSLINNMKKILSTKQNTSLGLDCVAGIKALAMIFIIAGHACLFIASGPVMEAEAWDRLLRQPVNAFMLNSTILVDTFLMLSAFLFSRLLLLELDKRKGKINVFPIFIFRYIRVTPAYLVILLFYMSWFSKIGDGPLWESILGLERERCMKSWWTNILYINNYINTDSMCMFQSWYLSVDTQMFFLAPLIIYPLWKWPRIGESLCSLAIVISALIPAIITYQERFDPTLMVYAKEFKDISQNFYFKEAYIKTHMKTVPYFMGLLFGYILHKIQIKNYKPPTWFRILAWSLSLIMGIAVTFSISIFYQSTYNYEVWDATMYAGLHKLGWSLANGWLIIASAIGYGGFLGKFLTWKFWVPISRLTFCAYLVNGIVELYYIGTLRHPLYVSFFNMMANVISHILLTFLLAIILCVLFESPIHGFERILLRTIAKPLSDNANKTNQRSRTRQKLESV